MTATASSIASGPGWELFDVICTAGVEDRPFEEQHPQFCVAVVTSGTFRYDTSVGSALMAPGMLLLGNPGSCFKCGHDHSRGDRCLSFHFSPDYFERVVASIDGATRLAFETPRLPLLERLASLLASLEAARDAGEPWAFEELGLRIAGAAVLGVRGLPDAPQPPSRRDEKRVSDAVRHIETHAEAALSLTELAEWTATSPYHFLRSFRQVTGMTPYQYLLRTRLHRAAVRLRTGDEPISRIAFDAGFNDLSTFNRRFRLVMGRTPSAYRSGQVN
ncbi:MAG TPA: AraC family transcriptional regulator [Rhizobiaceae bacterium]|nr:AraC family transcriptional regulator [Rhizobiaceae bacterium]